MTTLSTHEFRKQLNIDLVNCNYNHPLPSLLTDYSTYMEPEDSPLGYFDDSEEFDDSLYYAEPTDTTGITPYCSETSGADYLNLYTTYHPEIMPFGLPGELTQQILCCREIGMKEFLTLSTVSKSARCLYTHWVLVYKTVQLEIILPTQHSDVFTPNTSPRTYLKVTPNDLNSALSTWIDLCKTYALYKITDDYISNRPRSYPRSTIMLHMELTENQLLGIIFSVGYV